ncbi:MAG: hypothetical protein RIS52_2060 [Pseudomonadota bacterium]|jgi:OmpA-OmpF porin, OOP family
MSPMLKAIIGAAATVFLAWLIHGPLGGGARFIDALEQRSNFALDSIPGTAGVSAHISRDGALRRVITLSGGVRNPEERARISQAVLAATPDAFDARWDASETRAVSVVPDTGTPARAEQVQACQTEVDAAVAGQMINFIPGSAMLSAESGPIIDAVAASLAACAGTRVEISGHADATGGTAHNQRLSEERANAVAAALAERGVPIGRLVPRGYGEVKPLAAGAAADALAKNRRIEFSVSAARATGSQTGAEGSK